MKTSCRILFTEAVVSCCFGVQTVIMNACSSSFLDGTSTPRLPARRRTGVWLLRNSPWSFAFLDRWWSLDRFVRQRPGDRKSGDNDALIHLLSELREAAPEEYRAHVFEAPQCAFNSYLWRSSARNWWRLLTRRQITLNGLYQVRKRLHAQQDNM